MGLRGPHPPDLGTLKLYAAQWVYLLFGLRDGHRDLLEQLEWQQWRQEGGIQVRGGAAIRIVGARIISTRELKITDSVGLIREKLIVDAMRNDSNDQPQLHFQPVRHIQRNIMLPDNFSFGSNGYLAFLPIASKHELWEQLKHPRSAKAMQQTTDAIYRWMTDTWDAPENYRMSYDQATELYKAISPNTRLWNYPNAKDKDRPSSDNKRIEFFAKAFAGLMLGISPATATKKLSRWKLLKLWEP